MANDYVLEALKYAKSYKEFQDNLQKQDEMLQLVDGDSGNDFRLQGFDTPETNTKTDKYKDILDRSGLSKEEYDSVSRRAKYDTIDMLRRGFTFDSDKILSTDTYNRAVVSGGNLKEEELKSLYTTTGGTFKDEISQEKDRAILEKMAYIYGTDSPEYKALKAQRDRVLDMTGRDVSIGTTIDDSIKALESGAVKLAKDVGDVVLDTLTVGNNTWLDDIDPDKFVGRSEESRYRQTFENKEALSEWKRGEYLTALSTSAKNLANTAESLPEMALMFTGAGALTKVGKGVKALEEANAIEKATYTLAKNLGFETVVMAHTNDLLEQREANGDDITLGDRLGVLALTTLGYALDKGSMKNISQIRKNVHDVAKNLSKESKAIIGLKLLSNIGKEMATEGSQEYLQEWGDILSEEFGVKADVFKNKNQNRAIEAGIAGAGSSVHLSSIGKGINHINNIIGGSSNNMDSTGNDQDNNLDSTENNKPNDPEINEDAKNIENIQDEEPIDASNHIDLLNRGREHIQKLNKAFIDVVKADPKNLGSIGKTFQETLQGTIEVLNSLDKIEQETTSDKVKSIVNATREELMINYSKLFEITDKLGLDKDQIKIDAERIFKSFDPNEAIPSRSTIDALDEKDLKSLKQLFDDDKAKENIEEILKYKSMSDVDKDIWVGTKKFKGIKNYENRLSAIHKKKINNKTKATLINNEHDYFLKFISHLETKAIKYKEAYDELLANPDKKKIDIPEYESFNKRKEKGYVARGSDVFVNKLIEQARKAIDEYNKFLHDDTNIGKKYGFEKISINDIIKNPIKRNKETNKKKTNKNTSVPDYEIPPEEYLNEDNILFTDIDGNILENINKPKRVVKENKKYIKGVDDEKVYDDGSYDIVTYNDDGSIADIQHIKREVKNNEKGENKNEKEDTKSNETRDGNDKAVPVEQSKDKKTISENVGEHISDKDVSDNKKDDVKKEDKKDNEDRNHNITTIENEPNKEVKVQSEEKKEVKKDKKTSKSEENKEDEPINVIPDDSIAKRLIDNNDGIKLSNDELLTLDKFINETKIIKDIVPDQYIPNILGKRKIFDEYNELFVASTRIAVASYLKYNYPTLKYLNDSNIAGILGISEGKVNNEMREALSHRGLPLNTVLQEISQQIFKLNKKVIVDEIIKNNDDITEYDVEVATYKYALGGLLSLVKKNIVRFDKSLTIGEMLGLIGESADNAKATLTFIQGATQRKTLRFDNFSVVNKILPKYDDNVLDKPLPSKDTHYIDGTNIKLDKNISDMINKLNSEGVRYIDETGYFIEQHDDLLKHIMGYDNRKEKNIPANKVESVKGKNISIEYSVYNLKKYYETHKDKTMYFNHIATSNSRVMVKNNTINRQADKLHRFTLYSETDKVNVDINDKKSFDNFKISIANAYFGDISDKVDKETLLQKKWKEIINDKEYNLLAEQLANKKIDKELFKKKINSPHELLGLINYSRYIVKGKNKTSFEAFPINESDDKTSGIGLQTIYYFDGSENAKRYLKRVGVFMNTDKEGANGFYDFDGLDSYQAGALTFSKKINYMIENSKTDFLQNVKNAFDFLFHEIYNEDGGVSKWWRNLMKDPTMQKGYSAGKKSLSDAMFTKLIDELEEGFIDKDKIDYNIEKLETLKELLSKGVKKYIDITIKHLKDGKELNKAILHPFVKKQLMAKFETLYGNALYSAFNDEFSYMGRYQDRMVKLSQYAQRLMIEKFNEKREEIKGKLGRKLSTNEAKQIFNKMDKIYIPTVSGNKIPLFTFGFNSENDIKEQITVAHGKVNTVSGKKTGVTQIAIPQKSISDVGVKINAIFIQSTDSYLQAKALDKGINIYDAGYNSDIGVYSKNKNKAVYELIEEVNKGFNPVKTMTDEILSWGLRNGIKDIDTKLFDEIGEFEHTVNPINPSDVKAVHHNIYYDTHYEPNKTDTSSSNLSRKEKNNNRKELYDVYDIGANKKNITEINKLFRKIDKLSKKEFQEQVKKLGLKYRNTMKLYKHILKNREMYLSSPFEEDNGFYEHIEDKTIEKTNIIDTFKALNVFGYSRGQDKQERVLGSIVEPFFKGVVELNIFNDMEKKIIGSTGHITSNNDMRLNIGKGYMSHHEVFTHELLHKITNPIFDSKKVSIQEQFIRGIFNVAKKHLDKSIFKGVDEKTQQELWDYIFNNPKNGIREFVSFALSNPDMMEALDNMQKNRFKYKYDKNKTLYGNATYLIATAFKHAVDIVYNLIANGKISRSYKNRIEDAIVGYYTADKKARFKIYKYVQRGFAFTDKKISQAKSIILNPKVIANQESLFNKVLNSDNKMIRYTLSPIAYAYIHGVYLNEVNKPQKEQNKTFIDVYDRWNDDNLAEKIFGKTDKDGFVYQLFKNIKGDGGVDEKLHELLREGNLKIDGEREEIESIVTRKIDETFNDTGLSPNEVANIIRADLQYIFMQHETSFITEANMRKRLNNLLSGVKNTRTLKLIANLTNHIVFGKRYRNTKFYLTAEDIHDNEDVGNLTVDDIDELISLMAVEKMNLWHIFDNKNVFDAVEKLVAYQNDLLHKDYHYNGITARTNLSISTGNDTKDIKYVLQGNLKEIENIELFGGKLIKKVNNPFGNGKVLIYAVDKKYSQFQQGIFKISSRFSKYTIHNLYSELYDKKALPDIGLNYDKNENIYEDIDGNKIFDALSHEEKVKYLNYTSNGAEIFGATVARVDIDTKVMHLNKKLIDTLWLEYEQDNNKKQYKMYEVSKNREQFKRLPTAIKDYIDEHFDGIIPIRDGTRDLVFGYETFALHKKINNKLMKKIVSYAEDFWKEIVKLWKVSIVIKTPMVLINNIISNFITSFQYGLNPVTILKYQREGLLALKEYMKDKRELISLEMDRDSGAIYDNVRLKELERLVKSNSISNMIDDGMLQSIILNPEDSPKPFSNISIVREKLDKLDEITPDIVKAIGKQLYISPDTKLFKFMFEMTQASDFVARYALDKALKEQGKFKDKEIHQIVLDAFIQYDIPDHKYIKYLDDIGILAFQKYFMRIQRFLFKQFKSNPSSVIAYLTLGLPNPYDSDILVRGVFAPIHTDLDRMLFDVLEPNAISLLGGL